ncbi:MAG: GFA family protein [Gammaproteobacteria bacterium]
MSNVTAEGGCLCGAIRYRATGDSTARALCHCRSCRLASGAPSVAWVVFRAGEFAFVSGEPIRFHSSPSVTRTFCGKCGTPLTYQADSRGDSIDVTTATLDRADEYAPTIEIWLEEKLEWECANGALRQYPRTSVGA